MSTEDRNLIPSDRLLRRAIAWRIRLQYSDFTDQLHNRWQAWIDVPDHERAFEQIEKLWDQFDELRSIRERQQAQLEAALKHLERPRTFRRRPAFGCGLRLQPAMWMLTTCVAVLVGAVVLFSNVAPATTRLEMAVDPPPQQAVEYPTLQDVSTFETTPLTEIEVKVEDGQRIMQVTRGKAFFRAVNDPQRPMIVTTELVRITAVGTKFSVSNTDESVVVTVSEGRVELSPSDAGTHFKSGVALTLREDQQLVLVKNDPDSMLVKVAAR